MIITKTLILSLAIAIPVGAATQRIAIFKADDVTKGNSIF